jgi:hypothetical protein
VFSENKELLPGGFRSHDPELFRRFLKYFRQKNWRKLALCVQNTSFFAKKMDHNIVSLKK